MSVFCTDFFMKDNQTIKRKKHLPLAASVIIGCSLFIVTLSVISSFVSYNVSKNTLYQRYQAQMSSIIDTIEGHVDHDDMYQCVQTNVESEKYKETQKVFDSFAEKYSDLHYIYILRPVDDARGVLSVISGNTAEEYKTDEAVHLGDGGEGWYTDEAIRQLNEIYAQDNDVFFFEDSEMWGKDYTLARPVSNSLGQKYGLLCVDISVETIDKSIGQIVMYSLSIILGVGLLFTGALIAWMYFFVIRPVRQLRKSVSDYANSSHNNNNPEQLTFVGPKVLASREIQELSESVEKMSNDMKNYVVNIIEKEEEVQTLHTSIEEMDVVAYQDALTGVKNKAAYDRDVADINKNIVKGEKVDFAVVTHHRLYRCGLPHGPRAGTCCRRTRPFTRGPQMRGDDSRGDGGFSTEERETDGRRERFFRRDDLRQRWFGGTYSFKCQPHRQPLPSPWRDAHGIAGPEARPFSRTA